jgi:hypothetical protein
MKRLAVFLIALPVTGGAVAAANNGETAAAPVGGYYEYVYKVNVGSSSNYLSINVLGNLTPIQQGNCTGKWYAQSEFPLSDPRTQAMERIAIASLMGRFRVYVTTDGCTADGTVKLVGLQLER